MHVLVAVSCVLLLPPFHSRGTLYHPPAGMKNLHPVSLFSGSPMGRPPRGQGGGGEILEGGTSNCKINGHFSIQDRRFSGAILHSFCIFNGKIPGNSWHFYCNSWYIQRCSEDDRLARWLLSLDRIRHRVAYALAPAVEAHPRRALHIGLKHTKFVIINAKLVICNANFIIISTKFHKIPQNSSKFLPSGLQGRE